MQTIQGSWVGHTFALGTSNDAGRKKSRIRRSKEERKTMVESFINKYQKSNNGNFPSLNLTHKEVGGSFYTVREIVREIIQENRVLAPPKKYLDEHNHPSSFMEQHILGSSLVEHQSDLSESENFHIVTPILSDQSPTTNGELLSSSSLQFSDPELNDERVFSGLGNVTTKDKSYEEASVSHPIPNHYQDTRTGEVSNSGKQIPLPWRDGFENEKMISESEVLEENTDSDKPQMTNGVPINQDNSESTLQSSPKFYDSLATQGLGHDNEQYLNKKGHIVDDLSGAEKHAYMESGDLEILSKESAGGQDTEVSQVVAPNANSVVEIFPGKPVYGTVIGVDRESGELNKAAESSEDVENKSEKLASIESNSDVVNAKDEETHVETTLKLNHESEDENVVQNLHGPSFDDSKHSTTAILSSLDNGDVSDSGPKSSLLDETKVRNSSIQHVSEDPAQVRIESNNQHKNGGLKKMDRINLETWKGAPKKSNRPESNPVLAFVKAFFSAFIKFWS